MAKPTSTISTAVSIRVCNELLNAVKEYAIANELINQSGRPDKRGEPNLSQSFSELVRLGLGQEITTVSDSVSNTANDDLRDTVKKLCDSVSLLSDRLSNLEIEGSSIEAIEAVATENPDTGNALKDAIAAADLDLEQAYEIAQSRGYGGSLNSFNQAFSRQKEEFGQKYGLERWKKEQGQTKPYSYRDIVNPKMELHPRN